MLELRDLTVRYGHSTAVAGLSVDLAAGSLALLGANGAGKTSVLRAVSGLVRAEGSVRFDGTEVLGTAPERIARAGLIHVPEGRRVIPTLDVHENLLTGELARSGRTPTWTCDDVYDLFPALVPLRHRAGFALSGGEQQMVAIGRALVAAPRVLLLDEPSLGLSPAVRRRVFDVLAEVVAVTPIVLVEQHHEEATALCPRAVVLAHGEVVLEADRADLERDQVMEAYLGGPPAVAQPAESSTTLRSDSPAR